MIIRMVNREEFRKGFGHTPPELHASRLFGGYADDTLNPVMGVSAALIYGQWAVDPSGLIYTSDCSLQDIHDFIAELTDYLGSTLCVKLAPTYRDPKFLPCITAVFSNYAEKSHFDISYYIDLAHPTPTFGYEIRQELEELRESGFTFGHLQINVGDLSPKEMTNMCTIHSPQHTEKWQKLTVSKDGQILAWAYGHSFSKEIFAITGISLPNSPTSEAHLFLIAEAASHASGTGHRYLDLGQCTVGGIPRAHLCSLMEHIGATPSLSLTAIFEK